MKKLISLGIGALLSLPFVFAQATRSNVIAAILISEQTIMGVTVVNKDLIIIIIILFLLFRKSRKG